MSDVFTEAWWRPMWALAWITSKDEAFVRRVAESSGSKLAFQIAHNLRHHEIQNSLEPIDIHRGMRPTTMLSIEDAEADLQAALRAGLIKTREGWLSTDNPGHPIPSDELPRLSLDFEGDVIGSDRKYELVRFAAADVRATFREATPAVWNDPTEGALPAPMSEAELRERAYQAFVDQMGGEQLGGRGREADYEHMKTLFPGITKTDIRPLRAKLAPQSWKRPGRRPNK